MSAAAALAPWPALHDPSADATAAATVEAATWDDAALRRWIDAHLGGDQIIVVSDRQPYKHDRVDGELRTTRPASGLVTAIEPIIGAAGGTWIAHGGGGADREVVDGADAWPAPSARGGYRLRRVWLSAAEEHGYRHGFANAGLWPACHRVDMEPVFTEAGWRAYQTVNRRFADAVVSEARQRDPIVLVQDYHLALVPALVRERLPLATIVTFWHIPWTGHERMGGCPWLPALIDGLLGSDIVGFQTARHRSNFLDSAAAAGFDVAGPGQRCLIGRSGRRTLTRDYPISIAWPQRARAQPSPPPRSDVKLIVGVDRFDYTKGLLERFRAIEVLLASHPAWRGRLRLVQVASPSRTALPEYAAFRAEVLGEVSRINRRFAAVGWEPITLLDSHHDRDAIDAMYRAADLCLVTSLDDGMNLVCKEFIAARDDEQGVLVLSEFAGAAQQLGAALTVNPYQTAQVAAAIHRGLTMPVHEQRERMMVLRNTVRSHNVHRWAATMLGDALRVRRRRVAGPGAGEAGVT